MRNPTIGMFVGDAEIERRERRRLMTTDQSKPTHKQDWHDEDCAQRWGRDPCDCNYDKRVPMSESKLHCRERKSI